MKKIFIDPGHGGQDPGAVANGLREKDLTLNIALKTRDYLRNHYEGHSIKMSRTSDQTLSLTERTNIANTWAADYLVSIHINAGGGTGFESFIYNGNYRGKPNTDQLRSVIHDEIVKKTKFFNRGKKEANFHMLRESRMPAVLTENGFIDRSEDAAKLKLDSFLRKIAEGHALGIALALKLKKKQEKVYYRVVTGSFKEQTNATKRVQELRNKGFTSFITAFTHQGELFYRVVTGSFEKRENAEKRMAELKKDGFPSFMDVYKP